MAREAQPARTTEEQADRMRAQMEQADEAEETEGGEMARGEGTPITRSGRTELAESEPLEPLLAGDRAEHFRSRWSKLQPRFVDSPRDTVKEADALVAQLMQELAGSFSDVRTSLEEQWSRGDDVSTEDLRIALQRYRSFFERLLAA